MPESSMVISYKLGLGWRLAGKVIISYSTLRNLRLTIRQIFGPHPYGFTANPTIIAIELLFAR